MEQYVEMVRRHIVEDSEVQEICRRIYDKHRRALDILFEHRPDRILELNDHLRALIGERETLQLEHCSKAYVRFIPKALSMVPRVGTGWKDGLLLAFEFEIAEDNLMFRLVLGPGEAAFRNKVHTLIAAHPKIFNRAKEKIYPKWWNCHTEKWTRKGFSELDMEELKAFATSRFERFLSASLPEMARVIETETWA